RLSRSKIVRTGIRGAGVHGDHVGVERHATLQRLVVPSATHTAGWGQYGDRFHHRLAIARLLRDDWESGARTTTLVSSIQQHTRAHAVRAHGRISITAAEVSNAN